VRNLIRDIVRDLGHEAVVVPNGTLALEVVTADPPDLILSDVVMPGLTGFDLCRRLKGEPATRLIPVVLITAIGEEHKIEGLEAGADEFLSKPFSRAELRARIRSLLRMKTYTDELESAEAVLCSLGRIIEAKDPYTEGHCERLAGYALALSLVLGLPEEDLTALRRGAYLHDLGKVAVPEAILLKPGPLTPEERAVIKQHPVVGETICRPLRSFRAVLPIIRHHHERQDGSGYPDGLRGEAIPVTARILQVVDVFDALTMDRPYRRAIARPAALEILEVEAARGLLDLRIVHGFRGVAHATRATATVRWRVLLVEDNPMDRELVTELLRQEGCEVVTAESAEAGLSLAGSQQPDLILMDVQLPGMTGYEAAKLLRTNPATAAIPVVALTAHAMRGEDLKAREAGCGGYLTKPLDTRLFRETLRRLLPAVTPGQSEWEGGPHAC
jgi:putative two-component system response regulator